MRVVYRADAKQITSNYTCGLMQAILLVASFDVKCREIVPVGIEAFDFVNAERRLFGLTKNMAAVAKESIELDKRINEGFVYEHRLSVSTMTFTGAAFAYMHIEAKHFSVKH